MVISINILYKKYENLYKMHENIYKIFSFVEYARLVFCENTVIGLLIRILLIHTASETYNKPRYTVVPMQGWE